MRIITKNSSIVNLTDKDYLGEGGQGKVFVKNGLIYKIYHDPSDVIPEEKIKELSPLKKHLNILAPKELVYNKNSRPIGFSMDHVSDAISLPRLFTTGFRKRNSITPEMSVKLVEKMMETTHFIHSNNILIVDGNEFNYLVKKFTRPYFIDVDSYQTKHFPAEAIMVSVRDWHAKEFNQLTDWFSFAIVATRIFVGIHPFNGGHPSFKKNDLQGRMLANVSIFNKETTVPSATRDFSLIPSEFMNWFIDLFEKGRRTLPPAIAGKIIVKPQITIITGADKFDVEKIFKTDNPILGVSWNFGTRVIYTTKDILIDEREKYPSPSNSAGVIFNEGAPLVVDVIDGKLSIKNLKTQVELIGIHMNAKKKLVVDNNLYILNQEKFTEIKIQKIGSRVISAPGNSWNILPNSTQVFRGMLLSNMLGKKYVYIPYQSGSCVIASVPELDKYKIIDAKHEKGVCIFLAFKDGKYDRITIKFNDNYTQHTTSIDGDILPISINFTTLDNGVFILLTGEDTIEISAKSRDEKKIITNCGLNSEATLCSRSNGVFFYLDNKLYKLSMK